MCLFCPPFELVIKINWEQKGLLFCFIQNWQVGNVSLPICFSTIWLRYPDMNYCKALIFSLCGSVSHDMLISLRTTNRKKRIMVDFELFLGKFERIANAKGELCYPGVNPCLLTYPNLKEATTIVVIMYGTPKMYPFVVEI